MKALHSSFLFAGLVWAGTASAATVTTVFTKSVNTAIPDNNSSGLVSAQSVSMNAASIDLITLNLETAGGWNGDLYAYLQHSTGFSILLNRPGRTAGQPAGSASSGMNVTIADAAAQELHALPNSGAVTGTWQPDARNVDPASVLDTTPRTTMLSGFNGLDPNGTWTLFIADLAAGDQATLTSWSLSITGEAIPEPGSAVLLGTALLTIMRRRRR